MGTPLSKVQNNDEGVVSKQKCIKSNQQLTTRNPTEEYDSSVAQVLLSFDRGYDDSAFGSNKTEDLGKRPGQLLTHPLDIGLGYPIKNRVVFENSTINTEYDRAGKKLTENRIIIPGDVYPVKDTNKKEESDTKESKISKHYEWSHPTESRDRIKDEDEPVKQNSSTEAIQSRLFGVSTNASGRESKTAADEESKPSDNIPRATLEPKNQLDTESTQAKQPQNTHNDNGIDDKEDGNDEEELDQDEDDEGEMSDEEDTPSTARQPSKVPLSKPNPLPRIKDISTLKTNSEDPEYQIRPSWQKSYRKPQVQNYRQPRDQNYRYPRDQYYRQPPQDNQNATDQTYRKPRLNQPQTQEEQPKYDQTVLRRPKVTGSEVPSYGRFETFLEAHKEFYKEHRKRTKRYGRLRRPVLFEDPGDGDETWGHSRYVEPKVATHVVPWKRYGHELHTQADGTVVAEDPNIIYQKYEIDNLGVVTTGPPRSEDVTDYVRLQKWLKELKIQNMLNPLPKTESEEEDDIEITDSEEEDFESKIRWESMMEGEQINDRLKLGVPSRVEPYVPADGAEDRGESDFYEEELINHEEDYDDPVYYIDEAGHLVEAIGLEKCSKETEAMSDEPPIESFATEILQKAVKHTDVTRQSATENQLDVSTANMADKTIETDENLEHQIVQPPQMAQFSEEDTLSVSEKINFEATASVIRDAREELEEEDDEEDYNDEMKYKAGVIVKDEYADSLGSECDDVEFAVNLPEIIEVAEQEDTYLKDYDRYFEEGEDDYKDDFSDGKYDDDRKDINSISGNIKNRYINTLGYVDDDKESDYDTDEWENEDWGKLDEEHDEEDNQYQDEDLEEDLYNDDMSSRASIVEEKQATIKPLHEDDYGNDNTNVVDNGDNNNADEVVDYSNGNDDDDDNDDCGDEDDDGDGGGDNNDDDFDRGSYNDNDVYDKDGDKDADSDDDDNTDNDDDDVDVDVDDDDDVDFDVDDEDNDNVDVDDDDDDDDDYDIDEDVDDDDNNDDDDDDDADDDEDDDDFNKDYDNDDEDGEKNNKDDDDVTGNGNGDDDYDYDNDDKANNNMFDNLNKELVDEEYKGADGKNIFEEAEDEYGVINPYAEEDYNFHDVPYNEELFYEKYKGNVDEEWNDEIAKDDAKEEDYGDEIVLDKLIKNVEEEDEDEDIMKGVKIKDYIETTVQDYDPHYLAQQNAEIDEYAIDETNWSDSEVLPLNFKSPADSTDTKEEAGKRLPEWYYYKLEGEDEGIKNIRGKLYEANAYMYGENNPFSRPPPDPHWLDRSEELVLPGTELPDDFFEGCRPPTEEELKFIEEFNNAEAEIDEGDGEDEQEPMTVRRWKTNLGDETSKFESANTDEQTPEGDGIVKRRWKSWRSRNTEETFKLMKPSTVVWQERDSTTPPSDMYPRGGQMKQWKKNDQWQHYRDWLLRQGTQVTTPSAGVDSQQAQPEGEIKPRGGFWNNNDSQQQAIQNTSFAKEKPHHMEHYQSWLAKQYGLSTTPPTTTLRDHKTSANKQPEELSSVENISHWQHYQHWQRQESLTEEQTKNQPPVPTFVFKKPPESKNVAPDQTTREFKHPSTITHPPDLNQRYPETNDTNERNANDVTDSLDVNKSTNNTSTSNYSEFVIDNKSGIDSSNSINTGSNIVNSPSNQENPITPGPSPGNSPAMSATFSSKIHSPQPSSHDDVSQHGTVDFLAYNFKPKLYNLWYVGDPLEEKSKASVGIGRVHKIVPRRNYSVPARLQTTDVNISKPPGSTLFSGKKGNENHSPPTIGGSSGDPPPPTDNDSQEPLISLLEHLVNPVSVTSETDKSEPSHLQTEKLESSEGINSESSSIIKPKRKYTSHKKNLSKTEDEVDHEEDQTNPTSKPKRKYTRRAKSDSEKPMQVPSAANAEGLAEQNLKTNSSTSSPPVSIKNTLQVKIDPEVMEENAEKGNLTADVLADLEKSSYFVKNTEIQQKQGLPEQSNEGAEFKLGEVKPSAELIDKVISVEDSVKTTEKSNMNVNVQNLEPNYEANSIQSSSTPSLSLEPSNPPGLHYNSERSKDWKEVIKPTSNYVPRSSNKSTTSSPSSEFYRSEFKKPLTSELPTVVTRTDFGHSRPKVSHFQHYHSWVTKQASHVPLKSENKSVNTPEFQPLSPNKQDRKNVMTTLPKRPSLSEVDSSDYSYGDHWMHYKAWLIKKGKHRMVFRNLIGEPEIVRPDTEDLRDGNETTPTITLRERLSTLSASSGVPSPSEEFTEELSDERIKYLHQRWLVWQQRLASKMVDKFNRRLKYHEDPEHEIPTEPEKIRDFIKQRDYWREIQRWASRKGFTLYNKAPPRVAESRVSEEQVSAGWPVKSGSDRAHYSKWTAPDPAVIDAADEITEEVTQPQFKPLAPNAYEPSIDTGTEVRWPVSAASVRRTSSFPPSLHPRRKFEPREEQPPITEDQLINLSAAMGHDIEVKVRRPTKTKAQRELERKEKEKKNRTKRRRKLKKN